MKVDVTKKIYKDEDAARARLRSFRRASLARWFGRPHCQSQNALPLRHVAQCNDCREQFSVTVSTVFERSKIGLHKWVLAARSLDGRHQEGHEREANLQRGAGLLGSSEHVGPKTAPPSGGLSIGVTAPYSFYWRAGIIA